MSEICSQSFVYIWSVFTIPAPTPTPNPNPNPRPTHMYCQSAVACWMSHKVFNNVLDNRQRHLQLFDTALFCHVHINVNWKGWALNIIFTESNCDHRWGHYWDTVAVCGRRNLHEAISVLLSYLHVHCHFDELLLTISDTDWNIVIKLALHVDDTLWTLFARSWDIDDYLLNLSET